MRRMKRDSEEVKRFIGRVKADKAYSKDAPMTADPIGEMTSADTLNAKMVVDPSLRKAKMRIDSPVSRANKRKLERTRREILDADEIIFDEDGNCTIIGKIDYTYNLEESREIEDWLVREHSESEEAQMLYKIAGLPRNTVLQVKNKVLVVKES